MQINQSLRFIFVKNNILYFGKQGVEFHSKQRKEVLQSMLNHNIPAQDKADRQVYEARLNVCRGCDQLSNGTCMGCGCLVELRAAYRKEACPFRRWTL